MMKKFLLALSVLGLVSVSCSRDNGDDIDNTTSETSILPTSNYIHTFTYKKGNKLEKISSKTIPSPSETTFTYEGDLIKSINNTTFEYDTQQRLIKGGNIQFFYDKAKPYSIERKEDGFIKEITYDIDVDGKIVGASGIGYEENVTPERLANDTYKTIRTKDDPAIITVKLEYDDKNNFAKNIKGIDKIALYSIATNMNGRIREIGIGSKNNLTHYSYLFNGNGLKGGLGSIEGYAFKHEKFSYNDKNYPISFYNRVMKRSNDFTQFVEGTESYGPYEIKYNK